MKLFIALIVLSCTLTGCAEPPAPVAPAMVQAPAAAPMLDAGPKKRIAVAKFDAHGAFLSAYGGWDIGGGLAAQLTTALVNSGKFVVVERGELASVLREQELGMQQLVTKESSAQVGQLLGAQILIRGAVTEFEQRAGGGGLRLGVGVPGVGGTVGGQTTTGVVGLDLRLIDTTTGEVLQSVRAEAKLERRGITGDINVQMVTFGGDAFDKTVLGQATRQAIETGVQKIVTATAPLPWTGRVAEVAGNQVFLNAGSAAGVKSGDTFAISTVVRTLTDPASGALLGVIEKPVGRVTVVSTQEKFSIATMDSPFQTQRGDLVKAQAR
jgi:curli biogenesis system outer membrane secretion channel CsgG